MARIALVAHDAKKPALAEFTAAHAAKLAPHTLIATATTGGVLRARCPGLTVEAVLSGPLGGDQQIGAMIAEGRLDALVFFSDPLTAQPHDPDVKALIRIAQVRDIPVALNPATAALLVPWLDQQA
jgi:methylglyoxal synthase